MIDFVKCFGDIQGTQVHSRAITGAVIYNNTSGVNSMITAYTRLKTKLSIRSEQTILYVFNNANLTILEMIELSEIGINIRRP